MARLTLEVCLLLTISFHTGLGEYKRVCYFTNWAQYRPGIGKFQPADIDPSLCTHIIYAFGKLVGNTMQSLEWNDYQLYEQINRTKQNNPSLKTLLAMGGWTAGSVVYSNMVSTAESRAEFIQSSISYLRGNSFDGLDMDWEYPANRGGLPSDKPNFGLLVKELREAFEDEADETGLDRLLLTAAVAAGKSTIDSAYDVPSMAEQMDFINIMSYDLHGSWDSITGHNSPLFPRSSEYGSHRYLNIEYAANYWHTLGVPKDKLIIGLATYGRSFTLSGSQTGMGAAARGAGVQGQYTREAGFLSYYEICTKQESGIGWTAYDSEHKVPYYTDGTLWVGFDDEISLTIKVEWLVSEGYGGAMIWSLALDDFNKVCSTSKRRFPLVNTIKDLLVKVDNGGTLTTPSLPTGISSAALPPSTTPGSTTEGGSNPGGDFSCEGRVGIHADPADCSKFYTCEGGTAFRMSCPGELLFNSDRKYCDYPSNVVCYPQSSSKSKSSTTIFSSKSSPFVSSISTSIVSSTTSSTTQPSTTSSKETSTTTSLSTKTSTSTPSTASATSPSLSTKTTVVSSSPTTRRSKSTSSSILSTGSLSTPTSTSSSATKITTTKTTTTLPTTVQSTQSIPAFDFCTGKSHGFYPDPLNCNQFYYCYVFGAVIVNCQVGHYFNPTSSDCDYPINVECNSGNTKDSYSLTTSSSSSSSTTKASITISSISQSSTTSLPTTKSSSPTSKSSTSSSPTSQSMKPSSPTSQSMTSSSTPSQSMMSSSTPSRATSQPTSPLSTTPPTPDICSARPNGDYAHPSDCSKYITCFGSMQYERTCPSSLWWNPLNGNCDWKSEVKCDG